MDFLIGNQSFYNILRTNYGDSVVKDLQCWLKEKKASARYCNQNRFLLRCRSRGLLPPHVINMKPSIIFKNKFSKHIFGKELFNFKIKLLNLEISDNVKTINFLKELTSKQKNRLIQLDYANNIINYFECQHNIIDKYEKALIQKSKSKFKWLCERFYSFEKHFKLNNKWIKNLSNKEIPNNVACFLSLGEKFYTNPLNKDSVVRDTLVLLKNC